MDICYCYTHHAEVLVVFTASFPVTLRRCTIFVWTNENWFSIATVCRMITITWTLISMYGRADDNVSYIPVHSDQFCVLEWVLWLQLRHWALLAPPSVWRNNGGSLVITDHIYNKQTTQYYNLLQVKSQFHRQGRFITYYSMLMKVSEIDRQYCESIQHHESNSIT